MRFLPLVAVAMLFLAPAGAVGQSLIGTDPGSSVRTREELQRLLGEYEQAQQRIPSLLSLDQSFILVWPQVVALVALTVACFALAYVLFMRQEVRA